MTYGIIGTGAVGGYFGAKLAKNGCDVHFLLHRDYDVVASQGLQVQSCNGDFLLKPVQAYASAGDMPKCDVVLVALKSVNEHLLRTLLPPLLKSDTLVVLVQNGIGLEEDVQQWFPGTSLAAGLAFICASKTQPGVVRHECYGSINIGNYSCPDPQRIEQLVADLCAADVEAHVVDYHLARWRKAVWNMPFNGLTVVMNAQTDQLLLNPATEQLVRDLMLEIVGAARHLGVTALDEAFAEKMIEMTRAMVPYWPSMKLDYDFHRPMEIHYLYTRPLQMARNAGRPMPKLEMLEAQLRFLEQNHR
ncbi:MAG: putative 2-dehydropantoate 2-reductase [Bacteroidaceae bacterium]|nr:putative 2-dehydropantoate 2-reductase [Bacteroidaceae bacterium]